jgi:DNA repair protein RadA/Sms
MTRTRVRHRCTECGVEAAQWLGRCPDCGSWGTLVEEVVAPSGPASARAASVALPAGIERPIPIADVDPIGATRRSTGVAELDRVLDGGLVPGSVTLLGGEPGMGKSTLLLQALGAMAQRGARCLLVCAEESCEQVRLRAERIGALSPTLLLVAETSLPYVLAHAEDLVPDILAIDSIQTVLDPDLPGTAGSVSQVRECAHRIVRMAKDRQLSTLLVGHVTKDGALAGPRALEHVVDTVVSFEGDRHHSLRMVHAVKHRFGSTQELGLFEMTNEGLAAVPDASALFLADRRTGTPGSVVAPMLEGARPLLVEIQALVSPTHAPMPRRSAQGLDAGRLSLLLAVLQQRARLSCAEADVFANVAGGVRVNETGADLAVALAVASARQEIPVAAHTVALGEIGLGGELRQVPQAARRLTEASRLGFLQAIVPESTPDIDGLHLRRVGDLGEALAAAGLTGPRREAGIRSLS